MSDFEEFEEKNVNELVENFDKAVSGKKKTNNERNAGRKKVLLNGFELDKKIFIRTSTVEEERLKHAYEKVKDKRGYKSMNEFYINSLQQITNEILDE